MKNQIGFIGILAAAVLLAAYAEAKPVSDILKRDVVCRNDFNKITISQNLQNATIFRVGTRALTHHKISYLYNSGGRGQILALKIIGLDGLHEETTIIDIFELGNGPVRGFRSRATGYAVKVLERFACQYK